MRKVLVATHASFAEGIKETLDFIVGKQDKVETMCAYLTSDFNIDKEIDDIIKSMDKHDELIVLVDLMGGSVSNAFSQRINNQVHVISGVNFPMLLDIVLNQDNNIENVIQRGIESAPKGIVYINQVLKDEELNGGDDF